jgi:hypothetical protein
VTSKWGTKLVALVIGMFTQRLLDYLHSLPRG